MRTAQASRQHTYSLVSDTSQVSPTQRKAVAASCRTSFAETTVLAPPPSPLPKTVQAHHHPRRHPRRTLSGPLRYSRHRDRSATLSFSSAGTPRATSAAGCTGPSCSRSSGSISPTTAAPRSARLRVTSAVTRLLGTSLFTSPPATSRSRSQSQHPPGRQEADGEAGMMEGDEGR